MGSTADEKNEWWGEYVVLELVERAADAVLVRQRTKVDGPGDRLYSIERFRREFSGVVGGEGILSDVDVKVLLKHLERDKRVIVTDKEVRFCVIL